MILQGAALERGGGQTHSTTHNILLWDLLVNIFDSQCGQTCGYLNLKIGPMGRNVPSFLKIQNVKKETPLGVKLGKTVEHHLYLLYLENQV